MSLWSLDGVRPAYINYWGDFLAVVHDGPWCPLCIDGPWCPLCIGDRSDNQKIGSKENLRGCTWESSPCLPSLDLVTVALILRLSAPNFLHRWTRRSTNWWEEEIRLPERECCSRASLCSSRLLPACIMPLQIAPVQFFRVFWNRMEADRLFCSHLTYLPIHLPTYHIDCLWAARSHCSHGLWAVFNFFKFNSFTFQQKSPDLQLHLEPWVSVI